MRRNALHDNHKFHNGFSQKNKRKNQENKTVGQQKSTIAGSREAASFLIFQRGDPTHAGGFEGSLSHLMSVPKLLTLEHDFQH